MTSNLPTTSQQHDNDPEDIDDLDDLLDEFNEPKPTESLPAPLKSQPPPPPAAKATAASASQDPAKDELDVDGLEDILSQDFAKELAQGMEALMKELGSQKEAVGQSAVAADAAADPQFSEEELMKQFEAMMAGLGNADASQDKAAAGPSTSATSNAPPKPTNFNDALKATMSRLKQSDASATASTANANDPFAALGGADGDEMAKLLAALGGGGGEDGMDNPELAKVLEGMMDEMMSKEILHEPLTELRDKYPAYLNGPDSAGISAEERSRYELQNKYVSEIVAIFEDPKYSPQDKAMASKVQDLMNQMQDCGSPPQQIVGEMPAELENMPGFGGVDGECSIM